MQNFARRAKQKSGKKYFLMWFPTYYKIQYNGFQTNYNAFCFGENKWIEFFFSPILLSERNMRIDYIYNTLDYENLL